jgi:hypothetical protein
MPVGVVAAAADAHGGGRTLGVLRAIGGYDYGGSHARPA